MYGPSKSRRAIIGTEISVKGDIGFRNLWNLLKNWTNRSLNIREMVHRCLLWHSALGHTGGIWNRNVPNVRYRIAITLDDGTVTNVTWKNVGRPDIKLLGDTNVYDSRTGAGVQPSRNDLVVYHMTGRNVQRGRLGQFSIDTYLCSTIPDVSGTGGDTAIEKLKSRYPGFATENYDTDRIFISINGYPQAFVHTRPQDSTNRAVWGHMICMVNVSMNCVDPGRNKVKDSFAAVIDEAILTAARHVDSLITSIQDPVRTLDLAEILLDAERHLNSHPFPFGFMRFPVLALPNLPNDENYVVGLFYACIMAEGVKEIQIIKQGASQDAYDLIFHNQVFGRDLNRRLRRRIRRHAATYTNRSIDKITVGEFKTYAQDLVHELRIGPHGARTTRKDPTHIQYLVCWQIGNVTDPDWVISPSVLQDRIVRSSNYLMTHRQWADVRIEVLVLEEWLQSWEIANSSGTLFPY